MISSAATISFLLLSCVVLTLLDGALRLARHLPASSLQKTILKSETVTVPDGVTVSVKTRKLVVKGPRGTLNQDLSHLPIDLSVSADGKTVTVERWFTSGKQGASIRTACTHVNNMIIGVTKVKAEPCSRKLPCYHPAHRANRVGVRCHAALARCGVEGLGKASSESVFRCNDADHCEGRCGCAGMAELSACCACSSLCRTPGLGACHRFRDPDD